MTSHALLTSIAEQADVVQQTVDLLDSAAALLRQIERDPHARDDLTRQQIDGYRDATRALLNLALGLAFRLNPTASTQTRGAA